MVFKLANFLVACKAAKGWQDPTWMSSRNERGGVVLSTAPRQEKAAGSSTEPDSERERDQDYQCIASLEQLKKVGQLTCWIKDHDILLYEYEGKIKALSNVCRHFGGPVGYHKAKDGVFTCLWHNWRFSCEDGACLTHPGLPLRQYPVRVADGKIYVDLLG